MTITDVLNYNFLKLYHYTTTIEFGLASNTHNLQLSKNLIEPYVRDCGEYDLYVYNRKSGFEVRKTHLEKL